MSGIEDLLRDAYADAAQSVRPDRVRPAPVLPRVPSRRRPVAVGGRLRWRAFAPLAAALVVAAVIAAVVAVPPLLRETGPAPVTSAVPGAPPFVVLQPYYGGGATSRLVVQAAGTRNVEGFVSAPHGTSWEAVAATGSSTTFVAAAGSYGGNCVTRLYTLTLTASGKPAGLSPLNVPAIRREVTSLAASSDGRTIAYASMRCGGPPAGMTIAVIAGGTVRQWTTPDVAYGVSLSADGHELGYVAWPLDPGLPPGRTTGGAWILPTGSPPGSLFAHGHRVFAPGASITAVSAVLSPDGKTMYIATGSGQPDTVTLAAYRSSDGALLRTLHTWRNAQGFVPHLALGGSQLLVWAIYQPSTFQVDLATGAAKPFWVFTPDGEFPEDAAW